MAPVPVTSPPSTNSKSRTPNPTVTTLPDGSTVRQQCTVVPAVPLQGPVIAPQHTIGGARLAASGVIVSAGPGVSVPPEVSDTSYVISDFRTGQILAAKSPHALLYPASTLKTLTSLVTMPVLNPATKVTATAEQVGAEGTRVGLVAGGVYTVHDLYNALILVSANDAAYAIADAYGGHAKTLAAMNAKAKAIGAWDTVAKDPSGLDTDRQRTSAYDLALIGRAVMQLPAYRAYAVTPNATFPAATDNTGKVYPAFQIQNHNLLLENYPGTIGVKNGFTTLARQTFIGAATKGGRTLLITQMGGIDVPSWHRAAALLDWAFANAGKLQPVGTLVAPGTPAPPELGAAQSATSSTTSPTPSTSPTSTTTPTTTSGGSTPAPSPPVEALGAGGNPLPGLATTAGSLASDPIGYGVLLLLAALAGTWVAVRRRRGRDT